MAFYCLSRISSSGRAIVVLHFSHFVVFVGSYSVVGSLMACSGVFWDR